MNSLIVVLAVLVSVASSAPSGRGVESVIEGPSGTVTNVGTIGPTENGLTLYINKVPYFHPVSADPSEVALESAVSLGHDAAALTAGVDSIAASDHGYVHFSADPSNVAFESAISLEHVAAALNAGRESIHSADSSEVAFESAVNLEHGGATTFTAGGGSIAASDHGVIIRGPRTVPVVIIGPSGKIYAEGLWGPTSNIGGNVHGAAGHISLGVDSAL